MHVIFLPVNQCYAVMFGDSLTSVDGRSFFESLAELRDVLHPLGLRLNNDRTITSK